jgi:hypothetical protein
MNIEYIRLIKTERECLNLAKNAKKKGREDLEIAALNRAEEIKIEAGIESGRRPDINYHYIGLKNGDKLVLKDIGVEAEVYSERTISYKGREVYITPLEDELVASGHSRKSVVNKWIVKETGEVLNDLYQAAYGPKQNKKS